MIEALLAVPRALLLGAVDMVTPHPAWTPPVFKPLTVYELAVRRWARAIWAPRFTRQSFYSRYHFDYGRRGEVPPERVGTVIMIDRVRGLAMPAPEIP